MATADELRGICQGIAADGAIAHSEAEFLKAWLEQSASLVEYSNSMKQLQKRVKDMLADGIFTADEEAELMRLLRSLILPPESRQ